jgi:excisionase family DNA binding protein
VCREAPVPDEIPGTERTGLDAGRHLRRTVNFERNNQMFRSTDELGGASIQAAPRQSNESTPKRLLSKQELALTLGVSPRTLDNWIAQRRIPFLRLSARLIKFSLARVEVALARYEVREIGGRS